MVKLRFNRFGLIANVEIDYGPKTVVRNRPLETEILAKSRKIVYDQIFSGKELEFQSHPSAKAWLTNTNIFERTYL